MTLFQYLWIFLIIYSLLSASIYASTQNEPFEFPDTGPIFLEKLQFAYNAPQDSKYFHRIMDVCLESKYPTFKMTPSKSLELMSISHKIARKIAETVVKSRSFDDLILLAYLHHLSHKKAQIYDRSLPKSKQLNFGEYQITETLKEAIFFNNSLYCQNFFNYRCYELLERIFPDGKFDSNNKQPFLGSEKICKVNDKEFLLYGQVIHNPDTVTKRLLQIYDHKLFGYIARMRSDSAVPREVRAIWTKMEPKLASLSVVMTIAQDELYTEIPHYYLYMDTLHSVRMAASNRPVRYINDRPFWTFSNDNYNPDRITLNAQPIEIDLSVNETPRSCVSEFSIDAWFNHIQTARTAEIFDSTDFQYTSDHLLNVPKYEKQRDPRTDALTLNLIEIGRGSEIVTELTRLIESTLNDLESEDSDRELLVIRAVNISVLTTRFISRLLILNDANMTLELNISLVNLYNLIVKFTRSNQLALSDSEMSRLHFALCHICFVSGEPSFPSENSNRSLLERYHWFRAQWAYPFKEIGLGLADDQFNYGILTDPLSIDDKEHLETLLKVDFLNDYDQEPLNFEFYFDFNFNENIVRIVFNDNEMVLSLDTGEINGEHGKVQNIRVIDQKINHIPFKINPSNLSTKYNLEFILTDPALENVAYINFHSLYRKKYKKALLTDGQNVGVSLDLVSKHPPGKPFHYNLEGSHLLIAKKKQENNIKVLLISTLFAERLKENYRYDPRGYSIWLCDLSGRIVYDMNSKAYAKDAKIFDILPDSTELIFDALIFNGSLTHILDSPQLSDLYHEKWLKPKQKDRAEFLMQRMQWKRRLMIKSEDEDYVRLKIFAENESVSESQTGSDGNEDSDDEYVTVQEEQEQYDEDEEYFVFEDENEIYVPEDDELLKEYESENEYENENDEIIRNQDVVNVQLKTEGKTSAKHKLIILSVTVFCLLYIIIDTIYKTYRGGEYGEEEDEFESESECECEVDADESEGNVPTAIGVAVEVSGELTNEHNDIENAVIEIEKSL